MGLSVSKDEELFVAAQKSDLRAIRSYRQQGASLEWKDPKGRTALIVACSHPEGYDTAATLLQLGANVSAYRGGPEGGYPVHHAAKKGLDRTLTLLLHHGANLMVVNDIGQTPLQVARERGQYSTVRLIEDRISLFRGYLRQQTMSAGIFEVIAGNWVFKKVWVVVVPTSLDPRSPPRFELAIYSTAKASVPGVKVALEFARLSISKPESNDPVLIIEDSISKSKIKLLGDKDTPDCSSQIQRVFNACRGVPQGPLVNVPQWQAPTPYTFPATSPSLSRIPSVVTGTGYGHTNTGVGGGGKKIDVEDDDDVALKLAISASLKEHEEREKERRGGEASGSNTNYGGWGGEEGEGSGGRGGGGGGGNNGADNSVGNSDWLPSTQTVGYNGWGDGESSGANPNNPSSVTPSPPPPPTAPSSTPEVAPSAPPLPPQIAEAIQYPSIDTTPVQVPALKGTVSMKDESRCCVCLDAPKQGACVPCGHLACCMDCLQEIKAARGECPMCRAPIREIIKVYQV